MTNERISDFPHLLTMFLTNYLGNVKNYSRNTVLSYRDTFKILLSYLEEEKGVKRNKIRVSDLGRANVAAFLDWLQSSRGCSDNTRNQRLAAIHAFFKYVAIEAPEHLETCTEVLLIPQKKTAKPQVSHFNKDRMKELLEVPDQETVEGRRELAILCLLYDGALRVQELCDLNCDDIHMDDPAYVDVRGKGRKYRPVPLMKNTKKILSSYLSDRRKVRGWRTEDPLFINRSGNRLTRGGVNYIVQKNTEAISIRVDGKKVTPHVLRHCKAVHMLNAGVDIYKIKDFLGHESVQTTEVYAKLDMETKRKLLEEVSEKVIPDTRQDDWSSDESLMDFLESL